MFFWGLALQRRLQAVQNSSTQVRSLQPLALTNPQNQVRRPHCLQRPLQGLRTEAGTQVQRQMLCAVADGAPQDQLPQQLSPRVHRP